MKLLLLAAALVYGFFAFSVANVQMAGDGKYTADAGRDGKARPVAITAPGCRHRPAKGASAIIFGRTDNSGFTDNTGILFSDGGTCTVSDITRVEPGAKKK